MTGPEYTHALSSLSLTPEQAAIWLGIGRSTAYRYLKTGCEGAVARCLGVAVALNQADRYHVRCTSSGEFIGMVRNDFGTFICHSDLTAALGLPG